MFRPILTLGILAATCLPLSAQSIAVKATIPFEFQLGPHAMPPGDYFIYHSNHILRLRSATTTATAMVTTATATPESQASPSKLVFRRYGNEYFLAKVWVRHIRSGAAVLPVQREQELAARARQASPATIALAAK